MFQFVKATKEQSKLRLAIFGPSGAGKTYTALRLASGIEGKIAVIDTERGSASKYADKFNFDVLELPQKSIDIYVQGIDAAAKAGYSVLIIDSLSHAWKELLDEVEKLAKAKYRGNTWSAWSEGTPKQNKLVDAILDFPGHVIATMRSKTEWTTEQTDRGTSKPVRVGLAPEQGKGIEYEFDLLMEMSVDHIATVIKDRTGKYQDQLIDKPGEDFGKDLAVWLSDGLPPKVFHWSQDEKNRNDLEKLLAKNGIAIETFFKSCKVANWAEMENYTGTGKDAFNSAKELNDTLKEPPRPYLPNFIKPYIQMIVQDIRNNSQANDDEKENARIALDALVNEDVIKRCLITKFLFNAESPMDLTKGQAYAVIKWANTDSDNQPNFYAVQEAQLILKELEKQAGQVDMFDDAFPRENLENGAYKE